MGISEKVKELEYELALLKEEYEKGGYLSADEADKLEEQLSEKDKTIADLKEQLRDADNKIEDLKDELAELANTRMRQLIEDLNEIVSTAECIVDDYAEATRE